MTWGAALLGIISALGSGGVLAAVFKWISDRPKSKAHAEEVWRRMNSTALQEAEAKNRERAEEMRLVEFKFDLMADLCSEMLDKLNLDPAIERELKDKFMKIKYLQSVDHY